jgi:hypothetical protein
MNFIEQYIHPAVENMDRAMNDFLQVINHGVTVIDLESSHVE